MTYSIDLRERAVSYVHSGGSQKEACQLFGIGQRTLYRWLNSKSLHPRTRPKGAYKLNMDALSKHVKDYPDLYLRERASHFNVRVNTIYYALQRMNISKKNDEV